MSKPSSSTFKTTVPYWLAEARPRFLSQNEIQCHIVKKGHTQEHHIASTSRQLVDTVVSNDKRSILSPIKTPTSDYTELPFFSLTNTQI